MSYDENRISDLIDGGLQNLEEYQKELEQYLKEGINYNATPIKMCKKENLEQLAADSFFEGYKAALKNTQGYGTIKN